MAISEAMYLKMLWERNICPNCHGAILEGKRVGSGRMADGGFCSLDCFATYRALEFAEKARVIKKGTGLSNES
jgi:hypothetical protein